MQRSVAFVARLALCGLAVTACVDGGGGGLALPEATTVEISPNPASVPAGLATQLSAAVKDQNGIAYTDARVRWSTSAPSIATVSDSGLVTGVTAGSAVITATAEGKRGTVTVTVTPPPVAAITLTPGSATLRVGATIELAVTTRDRAGAVLTGRPVDWTTSNSSAVTVSGNGIVTAIGPGTAMITAISEGVSANASFTVTPIPVASIAISPTTASVPSGNTLTLQSEVRDSLGQQLVDRPIVWTSNSPSVAIVSDVGVVTGVSPGLATISATIEGKRATAAIDVTLPAFRPTSTTTLGGRVTFVSVTIPAGVTVNVNAPLVMEVTGSITIAGTLNGNCQSIQIIGAASFTVSGTIGNACTSVPTSAPPALRLIGRTGLNLRGAHILSSGHLTAVTDSSLVSSLVVAGASASKASTMRTSTTRASASAAGAACDLSGAEIWIAPASAPNGATGADGRRGNDVGVACDGDVVLFDTRITAQHGGNGGDASASPTSGAATATGGVGGIGGAIVVRSGGNITVGGSAALTAGNGGDGGTAVATASIGERATATGGAGGATANIPGTNAASVLLSAAGAINASASLQLRTGAGGKGGTATATGGPGKDATATVGAIAGGSADATGGRGGDAGAWLATAPSGVNGSTNIFIVAASAAQGGIGGTATANGGNGAKGNDAMPNGSAGGSMTARGGDGGRSTAIDNSGNPVALGGNGGGARFFQGLGGRGFAYCALGDGRAGGIGGAGGATIGSGGNAGAPAVAGFPTGLPGAVELENTANGGAGGHGATPGAGGARGSNSVVVRGSIASKGTNYQNGTNGSPCPTNVAIIINSDPFGNNAIVNYTAVTEIGVVGFPTSVTIYGLPGVDALIGTRNPLDATFVATGVATFGAIVDVPVRMTGTLATDGAIIATLTVGPAGLPNGPVVYGIQGLPAPASGVRASTPSASSARRR
jgi:trimeric autotransporter adhesin